jgi:hypothetical protein
MSITITSLYCKLICLKIISDLIIIIQSEAPCKCLNLLNITSKGYLISISNIIDSVIKSASIPT